MIGFDQFRNGAIFRGHDGKQVLDSFSGAGNHFFQGLGLSLIGEKSKKDHHEINNSAK
jgi:hypothetical protein